MVSLSFHERISKRVTARDEGRVQVIADGHLHILPKLLQDNHADQLLPAVVVRGSWQV
jgi:hypothetical protein